ncbi:hypothetical protein [Xenorhabdus sp. PB62.4]|uniref:hypothetical protein n=1 Tax=Xenorhabdus sp. PB62.4 TaxID=1851573 RepID=UPI001656A407|nr:hypothetical protein [Xenorhabdus sp. PB62.4]MBC8954452.1 ShlA/HecA/FhaA exofamily protein [Xenorhabdus sp. PB62.4]
MADLSWDTDNAANGLSPIFDKEKEQQRLAQAQAIAEIGTQVMDIYNTHEAMKATKKATADRNLDYHKAYETKFSPISGWQRW